LTISSPYIFEQIYKKMRRCFDSQPIITAIVEACTNLFRGLGLFFMARMPGDDIP